MQNDTQTIAQANRSKEEKKAIVNFRVPVGLRRRFRMLAADRDLSIQEAGTQAIGEFVERYEVKGRRK